MPSLSSQNFRGVCVRPSPSQLSRGSNSSLTCVACEAYLTTPMLAPALLVQLQRLRVTAAPPVCGRLCVFVCLCANSSRRCGEGGEGVGFALTQTGSTRDRCGSRVTASGRRAHGSGGRSASPRRAAPAKRLDGNSRSRFREPARASSTHARPRPQDRPWWSWGVSALRAPQGRAAARRPRGETAHCFALASPVSRAP